MKLTTRGRYALRIMVDVALYGDGEYVPLSDIAARQQLSVKYLEQIISGLRTGGLLRGTRGMHGGYMLTRSPAAYTIGDILRASEGLFLTAEPARPLLGASAGQAIAADHYFWENLDRLVNGYVDSITLDKLVDLQTGEADPEKFSRWTDGYLEAFAPED